MKCHVCGVDIPEGATHCPDCGTIIEVTEQGGGSSAWCGAGASTVPGRVSTCSTGTGGGM